MEKAKGQTAEFLEFQQWCKEKGLQPLLINLVDWMKEKQIKSVKLPNKKESNQWK